MQASTTTTFRIENAPTNYLASMHIQQKLKVNGNARVKCERLQL